MLAVKGIDYSQRHNVEMDLYWTSKLVKRECCSNNVCYVLRRALPELFHACMHSAIDALVFWVEKSLHDLAVIRHYLVSLKMQQLKVLFTHAFDHSEFDHSQHVGLA